MKIVLLTQGKVAKVSDQDYAHVSALKWCAHQGRTTFYALHTARINGHQRTLYLHRFVLGVSNSKIQVDHKDHNGLNNCRHNLRKATHADNMRNRKKAKGIRWRPDGQKWEARITVNRKGVYLGCFSTRKEALQARNLATKKFFGKFSHQTEEK